MSTVTYRVEQGYTFSGDTTLIGMVCPVCGVTHAIPSSLQQNALKKGNGKIQWFCPNGHQLGYHGDSAAEEARKTAEEEAAWYRNRHAAERDLRVDTENRLRAQKGATTKARKRHAAGVCPCCNRTFQQLQRHMASKHPDYDPKA